MTYFAPSLSAVSAVRHAFFGRNGAGETFGDHNCAYRAGDDPAVVDSHRAVCAHAVGAEPGHVVTVKQRHTADVYVATRPIAWSAAPVADAIVTASPCLAVGVLTADCAPVLMASADGTVVAAAHAGWRGAFDGVLENTVATMERLGAVRAEIIAVVGPCIGAASYEVGPEFVDRFAARDKSYIAYFSAPRADGHAYFDLTRFAVDRLRAAGVDRATATGHDTCAEETSFFSFRRATLRGEPDYGRQLSLIMRGAQ